MKLTRRNVVFASILIWLKIIAGHSGSNVGLYFTNEPPRLIEFSNNTGAKIECSATGEPPPRLTWALPDGTPVTNIASLRQIHADGTLVFPPFSATDYRQDIHAAVYRCVASNTVGTIVSRDVQVKAVLLQPYIVHIYDVYAILGNTAVMKCHVPTFLLDYVHVTSWIRDAAFVIQTTADREGKYVILPNGELHIREVGPKDAMTNFRCQTHHRLTGETRLSSSAGRLFLTEPQGNVPPRISATHAAVHVREGETAILSCVAQGYPVPNTTWFLRGVNKGLQPLRLGDRISQKVDALVIRSARVSDSATYVCVASNLVGAEQAETTLTVTAPLSVKIEPTALVAEIKKPAVFTCLVSGSPIKSVTWIKDGRQIVTPKQRGNNNEKLRIDSISPDDRGMYQCHVQNDFESQQATAEIRLGDIAPEFVMVFDEKLQQPGTSVSLRCATRGVPLPQISWLLDDLPLPRADRFHVDTYINRKGDLVSILNITHARAEDGGVYKCVARSKAGIVEHASRINIYGRPAVRPMDKMTVVAGKDVSINCAMYGYPIESVNWEKDGSAIPLDLRRTIFPNGTLFIRSVQRSTDSGRYRCIVRNKQSHTGHGEVEVAVMVSPKISPFSFQDEFLREGTQARVMCALIEGDQPVKFRWLRDGRPIISSSGQNQGIAVRSFDDFSSILTISRVDSHHRGNYTCIAENAAASASHTTPLKVNVPPMIVPFSFQAEHLLAGTLARVSCVVSQGDLPLSLTWEWDGIPVSPPARGLNVGAYDAYTSVLSIDPVSPAHNGNYTCVASNAAATMRYTAQLVVNVPPRWTLEPRETTVLVGRSAVIHCQVDGFPTPTITWRRSRELGGETYKVENSENFHVYTNGSLIVKHATEDNRGYYFCQASNGIGADLSRGIFLQVHVPVHIETKMQSFTVKEAEHVRARCEAKGDHPIDFTWRTDGQIIESGKHSRYYFKDYVTSTGAVSELTVTNAQKMDTRIFVCAARNPFGGDLANVQIIVQGVPEAPKIIEIKEVGNRSVQLTWNPPYDGNSRINKYILQYKPGEEDWGDEMSNLSVSGGHSTVVVRGLIPSVNYHFQIYAENSVGLSEISEEVTITMDEEVPGAPPQDLNVEATDPQTLRVTWKPPPKEYWNGAIRGYYVGYRIFGNDDPFNVQTVPVPDDYMDELTFMIPNLQKYTQYGIMIQAFNDKGLGPKTEEVVIMTSEDVPSKPPENVRCSVDTYSTLQVAWEPPPPDSVNGILRGYRILYKPLDEWIELGKQESIRVTTTEEMLKNLEKNVNYSIQVMGFTNMGDGVKSEPVYCKTKEHIPDPPAEIKVLPLSSETVLVVWKPPVRPNGLITKYNVYARELENDSKGRIETSSSNDSMQRTSHHNYPTKHPVRGDAVQYEVKGLKKNHRYEFWVTASTSIGEGQSTDIVAESLTGPIVAPKSASFSEILTTAWKKEIRLRCRGIGHPTPQREWTFKGVSVQPTSRILVDSDGDTLIIKNVQIGDAGNYTCRLYNRHGEDFVHYVVVILIPPSAPTLRILSSTLTSIELQWHAESSDKSPVQAYLLHYQPDNDQWKMKEIDAEVETYRLENLLCGTKYHIYVEAVNKIGVGEPSETLTIFTEGSVPTGPPKERLVVESRTSVTLNLGAWIINGCPILSFLVEYKSFENSDWVVATTRLNVDQRKYLIEDLKPETWYSLRVTAFTTAGSTVELYTVGTLTKSGATMSPEVLHADMKGVLFYLDLRVIIPFVVVVALLFLSIFAMCFIINRRKTDDCRMKAKPPLDGGTMASTLRKPPAKEFNSIIQNSDQLSRRYSSTPTRVALGSQEDLTPYAADQLPNFHYGELKTFGQRKPGQNGHGIANDDSYWQEKKSISEQSLKEKLKSDGTGVIGVTPSGGNPTYNTWDSTSSQRRTPTSSIDSPNNLSDSTSSLKIKTGVKIPPLKPRGCTEETTFIFPIPPNVNGNAQPMQGTLRGDLYDRLSASRNGISQTDTKHVSPDEATRLLK